MSATPAAVSPPTTAVPIDLTAVKRKHALRNHGDSGTHGESNSRYIIENIFSENQLGVVMGDSGIGKSPALYQFGICAAAGVEFLGERTVETDVLYLDVENGAYDSQKLADRISKFLGLNGVPDNFLRWNASDCSADFGKAGHAVKDILQDWSRATSKTGRPKLAIIDPLRFWLKDIENPRLADREIQTARDAIRGMGIAVLGIHHLRRVSSEAASNMASLEADPRTWIQSMSRGALALINGSDVRLGLEPAHCPAAHDKNAIALAGFRRVQGQIGPLYLERAIAEEDGEPVPIGYRRMSSVELLILPSHIEAFQKFPPRFTFKEARQIFGKADSPTANLLRKCQSLQLLRKEGREYVKTTG